MKVLLTGMTRPQIGQMGRSQTNLCSNPGLLAKAMRAAGHDVTWGPVIAGDDLSMYDCAIVGLSNMFSFGASWRIGAIWAAGHSNTAILIDDWNVWGVISTLQGVSKGGPGALFREGVLPTAGKEEGWKHVKEILGTVDELAHGEWVRPTIGSFFSWGDLSIFKRVFPFIGDIWPFDPSVYQPIRTSPNQIQGKDRKWVLASLPDHRRWVSSYGFQWPVQYFGRKTGGAYVQETEVVDAYRKSWGVLSPPYKHAGCGWWRNRFKYALDAGAIVLAEEAEVKGLGSSFTLPDLTIETIETMSGTDLLKLQIEQCHAFYEWMWSEDQFVEWADAMVRRLAAQ